MINTLFTCPIMVDLLAGYLASSAICARCLEDVWLSGLSVRLLDAAATTAAAATSIAVAISATEQTLMFDSHANLIRRA